MSISNLVLECARILTPTQTDKTLSSSLRQELADILVRLKVWAGNVGVFAPDNASVDYRLREDEDLVEVVSSMMRKLKQTLSQAIHPPLLEESDDGDEEENEGAVADPVSSGSSSVSLDLDSSVEESESGNDLERLGPSAIFIEEANDVINRLYRLAAVIRKPVSSSENAKIRAFMKKQNEKGDVEELADVEDHARCHIKAHFPQAPEFLVSRLVEAVVFRRMKIRYRQHHQAKLKQGIEPVFAAPALYEPSDEGAETPVARATLSKLLSGKRGSILKGMSGPQPTPRSVAFSATIASSVNTGSARLADYAKSSALSGITKAAVGRRQQLDVPPPPNDSGKDKVVCPYCLRLISQDEMRQPRWTRHILKDIDPLVCLFEQCNESFTLFKTAEEWLGHMRWQHTIVYSCQAVGHEREVFGSSEDLEDHIRGAHPGTFTESHIPSIVKQGALPTSNTIGALNLSLSLNESQCLLCHTFDPQPVDAETMEDAAPGSTPEQTMQSHILKHLEAIALLALPGSGDPDGVESDARQSSPGSDAEKKYETDDLPSAVFEDTVAERAADEGVPDQDGHDDCWAAVFEEVKQSHLLEPHQDPILIELGEARQKDTKNRVIIEDIGVAEETSLSEDASLDKKLGIKVVFHPKNEDDIDLDILAVHGIGADPETTWTYTGRDPQDESNVANVTWLSDPTMLPKEFPNARIMTFGYDSLSFGDSPSNYRLSAIAASVLQELARFRKDCGQRPILLICHCYGGLVMQYAYLTSKWHASDYPGMYDAITGIIFLGTPFHWQGSDIAHIEELRENYREIPQHNLQFKDDLLQTFARGNVILVDTVAEFAGDLRLRTAPPEIFCFYERRSTNIGLILGLKDTTQMFVAGESCSTLPGYEKRGLELDHFNLNKFGNNEDYHYISVVDELVKMAEKARDIMRKRGEALNKESRQMTQQSHSATHRSIPMLPFSVSKGFAERDGILEKIKANFDPSSRVVLVGPCGSGKTHVAVEYADGFLKENPEANIFYVHASNAAEFRLSFDAIRDKMKLRQGKNGDTMGAVRDFLKRDESGEWLIIIDGLELAGASSGADQLKEAESTRDHGSLQWFLDYIPERHSYGGNVLITMRSKSMATTYVVNHRFVVDVPARLSEEDVKVLFGGNAKDSLSRVYQTRIADLLQGSAGALALVRAYKETSGSGFSWKDLWKRVQASSSGTNDLRNSSQTEERVKAASGIWQPLYSQLGAMHEEAACLLHILSLLDVQSIPMFLIDGYFDNKSQRAEQIKALTRYNMLRISADRRDACITPLVRLSAGAMLDSNKLDDVSFLREAALSLVLIAYPSTGEMDNIKCKALGPCAMAALRLCLDSAELRYQRAQLLLKVAAFEKCIGRYDAAVEFLAQCLDLCKLKMKAPLRARKKLQKEAEKLLEEAQKEQQRSWLSDSGSENYESDDEDTAEHEFPQGGSSGVERDNENDDVQIQASQKNLPREEEDESEEDAVGQGSSESEENNYSSAEEGTLEENDRTNEDGPSDIEENEQLSVLRAGLAYAESRLKDKGS